MRTRMYGGVTGKAGDRLPMSIAHAEVAPSLARLIATFLAVPS